LLLTETGSTTRFAVSRPGSPDRAWEDVLQSLEAAVDEWSAMEAVVRLELLLEARDLLIESTAYASRSGQAQSRAT
jgi:hypothetical protein